MTRTSTGEYRCNWCKASLTAQETTPEHLTLTLVAPSGVASPDTPLPGWRVRRALPPGSYQFCLNRDGSSPCLGWWMAEMTTGDVADAV